MATWFGMHAGIAPFVTHVYEFAWWATLALLDGLIWWRTGKSPLFAAPLRLLTLSLWSVSFWFLFEIINLRLLNWYYVFVGADAASLWQGSFLAYATVLPGVLLCAQLLGAGFYREARGEWPAGGEGESSPVVPPRRRIPPWLPASAVGLGFLFLILPLVWPRYFYPLVWGSVFLFLEPLNYRTGAFSFLRKWEEGNHRPLVRFLLAGLVCGLWWEFWNHSARVKWVYTVPFFEEWKLFEMPLLGFLGFPPFALECAAAVAALERFRLVPPPAAAAATTGTTVPRLAAGVLVSLAITAGTLAAMDRRTFASRYPRLESFEEIDPQLRQRLRSEGVWDGFGLRERIRAGDPELAPHRQFVELTLLRGIGLESARALGRCGVESIGDLAARDARELEECLARQDLHHRPTAAEIRVWIRAAR